MCRAILFSKICIRKFSMRKGFRKSGNGNKTLFFVR